MDNCVFCSIVAGDSPAHIVYEDVHTLGFLDTTPLFHGHVLVVPKTHIVTLADVPTEMIGPLYERVQLIARALPIATGKPGTFVANNNIVSQSVAHLHVHVVPRQKGDGLRGFFWPRTRYEAGEAEAVSARIAAAIGEIRRDETG